MKYWIAAGLLGLILTASIRAQSPTALHGTVLSTSGKPLSGIRIYGNFWQQCCPAQQDDAKTDNNGAFVLPRPTDLVRVRDENFRPVTMLVEPGQTELRIILTDGKSTAKTIPACPVPTKGPKRVGMWFEFPLPRGTKIMRSIDADTFSHRVNFPHSGYWLLLWSGPLLGGTDADERLLKDSSSFSERWINGPDSPSVGIDAAGQSEDGRPWRSFGTAVDQASYSDVSEAAARYFDAIIDGACLSQRVIDAATQSAKP